MHQILFTTSVIKLSSILTLLLVFCLQLLYHILPVHGIRNLYLYTGILYDVCGYCLSSFLPIRQHRLNFFLYSSEDCFIAYHTFPILLTCYLGASTTPQMYQIFV